MSTAEVKLTANAAERSAPVLDQLVRSKFATRLFAKDDSLWGERASDEAAIRLGWVDFAQEARQVLEQVKEYRAELLERGITRLVLCGMGGSSLAPYVITRRDGFSLTVLDSTHPDTVRSALSDDVAHTVAVVSSKSGSTVETLSHRAVFAEAFAAAGVDPADHVVVVTDPGSRLEASATAAGQRVFHADPNVGGRFSALTAFGIVPAGLAGSDIDGLLREAESVRPEIMLDSVENPALQLAAAIFAELPERYVLELVESVAQPWGLGLWIEQLVAESTGKNGKGVLPLSLPQGALPTSAEPARVVELLDEHFVDSDVQLASDQTIAVAGALGAQFLLWEVATAALGHLIGVDPFNQPDVESAKVAARKNLTAAEESAESWTPAFAGTKVSGVSCGVNASIDPGSLLAELRRAVPVNGYIAIQVYGAPEGPCAAPLERLRSALADTWDIPVSLGWGPRYLHSVGQFHKGGRPLGVFLQIIDTPSFDLDIPGGESSFASLMRAQANGDAAVLRERGRSVLRVSGDSTILAIDELIAAVSALGS
ncbi:glucose-6-phosphate isomerase [Leucobacter sp. cx-328]|uniref:glucose-6-phosphate isomerase n=1 Tax=unclassified Leucobacter TaxID=2621730 RepID=UPI00165D9A45|nr:MULTISPECIES: glucose-6-phosphate isomerase [unclassified Leucobacter]MBC9943900.1 glucose-6-phosphate isomerase [Leucobacter sp. cx-328]